MKRMLAAAALLLAALTACGSDPFLVRWEANPQEAVIYSLDRDELNSPSGFDMLSRSAVVIENLQAAAVSWDFVLDREGGQLVLLPPRVLGVTGSRAGIVPFPDTGYEDVRRAPSDTAMYITDEPVPIEVGTIYVVRTHERVGSYGRTCVYYGKLEPLEADFDNGVFRFLQDTSPDCNNPSLVPPT
jgi:hypothetical protein